MDFFTRAKEEFLYAEMRGFPLGSFETRARLMDGRYHYRHCTRLENSERVSLTLRELLEDPSLACEECFGSLTFGMRDVDSWLESFAVLKNAEITPSHRLETIGEFHDFFDALPSPWDAEEELYEWGDEIRTAQQDVLRRVARLSRPQLEPSLVEFLGQPLLEDLSRLDFDALSSNAALRNARALMEEELKDLSPSILVSSEDVFFAFFRETYLNWLVTEFYRVSEKLFFFPPAVAYYVRQSRPEIDYCRLDALPQRLLESLNALYDPDSNGPFTRIASALKAASALEED